MHYAPRVYSRRVLARAPSPLYFSLFLKKNNESSTRTEINFKHGSESGSDHRAVSLVSIPSYYLFHLSSFSSIFPFLSLSLSLSLTHTHLIISIYLKSVTIILLLQYIAMTTTTTTMMILSITSPHSSLPPSSSSFFSPLLFFFGREKGGTDTSIAIYLILNQCSNANST